MRTNHRHGRSSHEEGHEIAWEFDSPGGAYTGRMLIDGDVYTASEATKRFLKA
jgi:hypothetical protein